MAQEDTIYTKPFLRWAGGKSWLTKHLGTIIGSQKFNNYYEPFLGGGAVFFYLSPSNNSLLSDLSPELIQTYRAIQEDPCKVIKYMEKYKNTSTDYYAVRKSQPTDNFEIAARFIYLNQTSFNGLYPLRTIIVLVIVFLRKSICF